MSFHSFDSIQEFVKACEPLEMRNGHTRDERTSWTDSESFDDTLKGAIKGDLPLVAKSDKFLESVENDSIETIQPYWAKSPQGAFVSVPDHLSGSPYSMRTRRKATNELAPVNIYISTTCSGGIDGKTMTKRGLVALALLRKMEAIRPVSLYLLCELGSNKSEGITALAIKMQSQPIDLSVACYALAHVAFARNLTYQYSYSQNGNGGWPQQFRYSERDGGDYYSEFIRSYVGMGEQDIYIPPAKFHDQMLRNPVEWINEKLKGFGVAAESEE